LFIMTQHVHPLRIIMDMHSQHCAIIALHCGSPLVYVTVIPSAVISLLHIPMIMLHRMAVMPFIIMTQLIMPLPIMDTKFCIILVAISSIPVQRMRMPPSHGSISIVHRGIIIPIPFDGMFIAAPMPIIPIVLESIMVFVIVLLVCDRRGIPAVL